MRQAITTKYIGPTKHRGSRVVARAQAGEVTLAWDDALDIEIITNWQQGLWPRNSAGHAAPTTGQEEHSQTARVTVSFWSNRRTNDHTKGMEHHAVGQNVGGSIENR